LQLREEGLHLKGKEIEGLMWFFQGTTCKSRWRRENNEKKKEKQTCVDPTCMCHHGRKKHRDELNDTAEAWLIPL
jgi:hypothetical protein